MAMNIRNVIHNNANYFREVKSNSFYGENVMPNVCAEEGPGPLVLISLEGEYEASYLGSWAASSITKVEPDFIPCYKWMPSRQPNTTVRPHRLPVWENLFSLFLI